MFSKIKILKILKKKKKKKILKIKIFLKHLDYLHILTDLYSLNSTVKIWYKKLSFELEFQKD